MSWGFDVSKTYTLKVDPNAFGMGKTRKIRRTTGFSDRWGGVRGVYR